jgi:biofilm PGA synthesis lipoprotein PgaB
MSLSEQVIVFLRKYLLIPALLAALFLAPALPAAGHARDDLTLVFDGKTIGTATVMVDGQVMVPLRSIAEALDMKVSFDSRNQLALVDTPRSPDAVNSRGIGLWVRDREVVSGIQPQLNNGRLMVSLCTVARAFDVKADLFERERLVWLTAGGSPPPERIYYRDRAVVLLYHHFADWERDATITAERFAGHLEMLEREGFNVVSLNQIAEFLEGRGALPPNAVAVTMDDGYESNYTLAYPLLKERGWPATVFMIVAGAGSKDSVWLPKLDWDQMREMSENGFAFYSHTYSSHYYTLDHRGKSLPVLIARKAGETEDDYRDRVFRDLILSREKLMANLEREAAHFSPPYGRINEQVVELVRRAGYKYIWTIEPKPVTRSSSPVSLGRVNAGSPNVDAAKLKDLILRTAAK